MVQSYGEGVPSNESWGARLAREERRTKTEAEARLKAMTAKERQIGLDVATLQEQVEERRLRELKEKDANDEFDQQALLVDNHLHMIEIAKQQAKREREVQVKEYSIEHLHKGTSREYELSDPDILKKQSPTRKSDDDPNLGVSSAQILVGEDILKRERERQQARQQKSWIEQQVYEKALRDEEAKQVEDQYYAAVNHTVNLRGAIEAQEAVVRRDLSKRIQSANFDLARHKMDRAIEEAEKVNGWNATEIEYMLNSPLLNETPEKTEAGELQKRGSTLEERMEVRYEQETQVIQKQEQKIYEQDESLKADQDTEGTRKLLLLLENQRRRDAKAKAEENARQNLILAEEQRARQKREREKKLEVGNIFAA